MFFVKAEQEKEGVRKKVAGFEGNKLMPTNEVEVDQYSGVLLDRDAERPPL